MNLTWVPHRVFNTYMPYLPCKNKTLRLIESLARRQLQLPLTTLDFSSISHLQTQLSWFWSWLWFLAVSFYISCVITMFSDWRKGRGPQQCYLDPSSILFSFLHCGVWVMCCVTDQTDTTNGDTAYLAWRMWARVVRRGPPFITPLDVWGTGKAQNNKTQIPSRYIFNSKGYTCMFGLLTLEGRVWAHIYFPYELELQNQPPKPWILLFRPRISYTMAVVESIDI